jgi:hypothetical protein
MDFWFAWWTSTGVWFLLIMFYSIWQLLKMESTMSLMLEGFVGSFQNVWLFRKWYHSVSIYTTTHITDKYIVTEEEVERADGVQAAVNQPCIEYRNLATYIIFVGDIDEEHLVKKYPKRENEDIYFGVASKGFWKGLQDLTATELVMPVGMGYHNKEPRFLGESHESLDALFLFLNTSIEKWPQYAELARKYPSWVQALIHIDGTKVPASPDDISKFNQEGLSEFVKIRDISGAFLAFTQLCGFSFNPCTIILVHGKVVYVGLPHITCDPLYFPTLIDKALGE